MSVIFDAALSQSYYINEAIASATPMTIIAWVKITNLALSNTTVSICDKGEDDHYFALAARGDQANDPVWATTRYDTLNVYAVSTTGYSANVWQLHSAVFGASNSRDAMINGGSEGSEVTDVTDPTGLDRTGIGYLCRASEDNYTTGKIAEVAIWDIALSDAEILQLAQGIRPSTVQAGNLQAYWPLFDDALDDSGNNKTLTARNAPLFDTADHPPVGRTGAIPLEKTYSKKLIAIGNNEVWYESVAGVMTELTAANGEISCVYPLTAAEGFQKIFIANKDNLKVVDFVNTKITTDDLNTHAPDPGTVLTGGTSSAVMIVDYITSTTADAACTIYGKKTTTTSFMDGETVTGKDDDNNSITFVLSANGTGPRHWYDWTVFGNDSAFGTMPSRATIVCRYRGRMVLSGDPNYPHQWYMSKVGFPFNFAYGTSDPLSAVAGRDGDAGEVGDIVTAMIPYGDDYLVIGCANSVFLLDGDPVSGGSLDEIANYTGIFGVRTWCKDSKGNLYFWGSGGLYKMEGGRGRPVNISIGTLPNWTDDWAVNILAHRITLSYDPFKEGIIVSRTTLVDGTNLNYWYDFRTQGFYPESYPTACGIFSSHYYDSDAANTRTLLIGCNDGYIRRYLDTAKSDDAGASDTLISSYFTVQPIPLGDGADAEGKIRQIVFESAGGAANGSFSDTDGFSYDVHVADDAETLIEDIKDTATPALTGTISGTGRKARIRQNIRGMYGTIRVYDSSTALSVAQTFVINKILIEKTMAGGL